MPARRTMEMHRFTIACVAARVSHGRQRVTTRTRDPRVTIEVVAPRGDYASARARAFAQFKAEHGADSAPRLLGWSIGPCLN